MIKRTADASPYIAYVLLLRNAERAWPIVLHGI
jgi:hypothetical protein